MKKQEQFATKLTRNRLRLWKAIHAFADERADPKTTAAMDEIAAAIAERDGLIFEAMRMHNTELARLHVPTRHRLIENSFVLADENAALTGGDTR